jgi:high-affinity nickel permease
LKWPTLSGVIPRLGLIGLTFAQPFMLYKTIQYAEDPVESYSIGYGLLGAYVIVYMGSAVSLSSQLSPLYCADLLIVSCQAFERHLPA